MSLKHRTNTDYTLAAVVLIRELEEEYKRVHRRQQDNLPAHVKGNTYYEYQGPGNVNNGYWCSCRYETADISHQVARQICIDTQPKKIKLQSYFHVKVDKNVNPLILFFEQKDHVFIVSLLSSCRSCCHAEISN